MKLISLNLWCGIVYEPLRQFIKEQGRDTDIFCFQEVVFGGEAGPMTKHNIRGRLFEDIEAALPDHRGYRRFGPPDSHFWYEKLQGSARLGQAIFVRKNIQVKEEGGSFLYTGDPFHGNVVGGPTGNFNYVICETPGQQYAIGNVHGLWQGEKNDTPERLEQSRRLVEFFSGRSGKKILVGDFNVRPATESIAMLGKQMRNLIAEYKVQNTRTSKYEDMEKWQDYIADYVFISKDLDLKDFKVLPDIVSDHAPLMLECNS